MAGEWNGIPFQPHTLTIAGSVSAPLRSALSGRPLDVQRPAPATFMLNGSAGKAPPSYGVKGRFESGFCKGVSHVDTVQKRKTDLQLQCRQMKRRQKKRSKKEMAYTMICKQHRHEEKRFWFHQERRLVMPVSELQIIHERKVLRS